MLSEICIKTNKKVWVETDIQNCYDQLRVSQVMNIAELLLSPYFHRYLPL